MGVDRGRDLRAVLGLADDLQVGRGADHEPQAGPHERVVVDDQHPDRRAHDGHGSHAQTRKSPARGRPVLEAPAREADALLQPDQPGAGARDRGVAELRERPAADDLDRQPAARRAVDDRLHGRAGRVLERVRQPLLHDPVDGPAGGGRHEVGVDALLELDRRVRRAALVDELGDVGERRLRALALVGRRARRAARR